MVAPCGGGGEGGWEVGRGSCEGREKRLSCKKTSSRLVLVGGADPRQEPRNWVLGRE